MGQNYSNFYKHSNNPQNKEVNNVEENRMEKVFNGVIDNIVTANPEVKVNEEGNMEMTVNVDTESLIQEADVLSNEEVETLTEEDVMDAEVTEQGTLVKGVVIGCIKLNVRKEAKPGSEVLLIIDKDTEVNILLEESTEEFYKVTTSSGVEGYCMKQYIEIK